VELELRRLLLVTTLVACGEQAMPSADFAGQRAPIASAGPLASAAPSASVAVAPAPTHPPPQVCPPWTRTVGGDFTPASLELGFWLDTDPANMIKDDFGKPVWRDRTKHLDAQWSQGYCPKGPEYVPAQDGQHGQFRFHESSCIAVDWRCQDEPSFDLGTGDFSLFVVAAYAIDGVLLTAFNQVPRESPNFVSTLALRGDAKGLHLTGLAKLDAAGSWLGAWHVYGIERRGDKVDVSVDGAVKASASGKPGPTASQSFFLGLDEIKARDNVGNPYILGFMGDVIGVKGRMTDAERAQLLAYLKKKFAPLLP
jgi:hypothetical protein